VCAVPALPLLLLLSFSLFSPLPSCSGEYYNTAKQKIKRAREEGKRKRNSKAGKIIFFLAFGRCRTEARSLHEHKQSERHLYKDPGGPSKLANQNKPEKHKTNNHDDPQIPQPDLRFVKRKQQTRQKNGARPKQKNNHNKDLPKDTADLPLCHSTKACKVNYPPRHSVKHEDRIKNEWLRYQEWKTVH
jgi:hypothetical protein